ncbi:hypothetical protein [Xanthomonas citri]|uniref:hypothetical protein n=1 Tax=Xanthomonas citri TaxID=346 RepID=UPI001F461A34|nr:hypothetical protein [Xanthomonas citri]UIE43691.1 hypothetical protein FICKIIDM_02806 [Xanthomonas citri pv. punicae]UIS28235.1 hypothetical protein KOJCDNHJ_01630 [Xanthomonas citri pv. punicae]
MKIIFLIILILMMTILSGCNYKMCWKEQVWLDEGRFVEVERYSVGKLDFPNSSTVATQHQEFKYPPLGVSFSTDSRIELMSFYVVGADAYLIIPASGKREKFCSGKRKGDYQVRVIRWRNEKMQEVDQHDAPIESMRLNLSGNSNWKFRHEDKSKKYLSWQDVAKATGQSEYSPPMLISEFYKIRKHAVCH